jgi:hypothetical protein
MVDPPRGDSPRGPFRGVPPAIIPRTTQRAIAPLRSLLVHNHHVHRSPVVYPRESVSTPVHVK